MLKTPKIMGEGWREVLACPGMDLMCEIDSASRYLAVSASYADQLGYAPADLLGRTPFELGLIHPSDLETMQRDVRPLFEANEPVRFDYRFRDAMGLWHWFESTGTPFLTPEGAWRALMISRDISDRTSGAAFLSEGEQAHMEAALKVDASFLRNIIDHNPIAIQILDREGHSIHTNAAFRKLYGSLPPPDYSVFEDPLVLSAGLAEQFRDLRMGQVVYFPTILHNPHAIYANHKDNPVWVWLVAFPILDAQGQPERYVLMHSDMTERRHAEMALEASEARFREFVEGTDDLVTQVDGEGRILYVNRAAAAAFGLGTDACVDRNLFDFLHPDDRVRTQAAFQSWIRDRQASATCENRCVSQAGEVHHLLWTVNLHFDEHGPTAINSIARDITHVKRTEDILRQTQKLESLGVLAGGIAHDFNNLLTAIMGNLNLAQFKLPKDAPVQAQLDAVQRTVLKAADLTRQMLAYSGKGRFVVQNHDLNALVKEMAHLLHVSIPKKVALQLRLSETPAAVVADGAQIQQVIMNLVTNAADAIGNQEGTITLCTSAIELDAYYISQLFSTQNMVPGHYVCLEVSDTGCGIPAHIQEKIFDPFFTTKSSGRGLGLSALLGILRGHRGGFRIYSEPGRGTTFKVLLPMSTSQVAATPQEAGEDPVELHGTVLLVDDESSILEALKNALESFGMRVLTAGDGKEAWQRFRKEHQDIDIVLMDLTMPHLDGQETFQKLRKLRPDIPVILSSGYNEQDSIHELLKNGLAGFIQKPYQLNDLKKRIASVLQNAATTR